MKGEYAPLSQESEYMSTRSNTYSEISGRTTFNSSDHDNQTLDIRQVYSCLGAQAGVTQVRRSQFLRALESLAAGNCNTLYQNISVNQGDPVTIAYYHEPFVVPGGTLANFVQTLFSLSSAQMTSLFNTASSL